MLSEQLGQGRAASQSPPALLRNRAESDPRASLSARAAGRKALDTLRGRFYAHSNTNLSRGRNHFTLPPREEGTALAFLLASSLHHGGGRWSAPLSPPAGARAVPLP